MCTAVDAGDVGDMRIADAKVADDDRARRSLPRIKVKILTGLT
jgi:hypothetical protein